jgi:hypothetical protein
MESMELVVIVVVSADAQRDDLDMLSEELVQYHLELERNVIDPTNTTPIRRSVFFPCSAPSFP